MADNATGTGAGDPAGGPERPRVPPRHHRGDLWALWDTWGRRPGTVLVVTVNATRTSPHGGRMTGYERLGPMGKGCARMARLRHPDLQRWWSGKLSLGPYGGPWQPTPIDPDATPIGRRIGLLVTKRNWWELSSTALVSQGLAELAAWADSPAGVGCERYIVPLPGAGCGGLAPDLCKALCREHLDDRFVICTPN